MSRYIIIRGPLHNPNYVTQETYSLREAKDFASTSVGPKETYTVCRLEPVTSFRADVKEVKP